MRKYYSIYNSSSTGLELLTYNVSQFEADYYRTYTNYVVVEQEGRIDHD